MNPNKIQRLTVEHLIGWMTTTDFKHEIVDNLPFGHPLLEEIWPDNEEDDEGGYAVFEETIARIVHNLTVELKGL